MKTNFSYIFKIYSEAWIAAALAIGALLELFCAAGLFYFGSIPLACFAIGGFVMLGLMAFVSASEVYFDLKK